MARLEEGVDAPCAVKGGLAADGVVLGADVEEANLLKLGARVVAVDGRDVDHAEPGAVVGLVGHVADDVLVVVDGDLGALVDAAELGPGEVCGNWSAIRVQSASRQQGRA